VQVCRGRHGKVGIVEFGLNAENELHSSKKRC